MNIKKINKFGDEIVKSALLCATIDLLIKTSDDMFLIRKTQYNLPYIEV